MQIYKARGKRRIYFFGIGDEVPLDRMPKSELTRMYFPLATTPASARASFRYLLVHARLPKGHLTDWDDKLCREDGNIYLMDVLKDLHYSDCSNTIAPEHLAAILHFIGSPPDEEDLLPQA